MNVAAWSAISPVSPIARAARPEKRTIAAPIATPRPRRMACRRAKVARASRLRRAPRNCPATEDPAWPSVFTRMLRAANTGIMAPTPAAARSETRARNSMSRAGWAMPTARVRETGQARESSDFSATSGRGSLLSIGRNGER
jgi:hypothetical protein